MNLYRKIIHALEYKYAQFSLRGKISFVLITSVSIVCGLVMLASYISTHYLILNYTHELLNSKAELGQRELEIRLSAEIQSATEFSNNFITANALADTQESELYLAPFLKNQKHVFAGTGFTVADYRGRSIASNLTQKPYYGNSVTYAAMMQSGKAQIQVQENDRREKSLVIALPVQYRLTNQVEGGVVLDIPLKSMLLNNTKANFHWLVDDSGAVIAGKQPYSDDVIVSSEHAVRLPFGNVHLKYFLARDRGIALQKIDTLLVGYLGIALAAIAGLLVFARFSARHISGPLEYLSKIAHEITSSGRPQSRIHIDSKDEYGALAEAFNTMFARLSDVYEDLEARVKARTSELENARNLLHEAVGSTTHGVCIFDQQDRLLVFNEAYREYSTIGDYLKAGRSYNEILTKVADGGGFEISAAGKEQWIRERLAHHLKADASPFELKRQDGRWYMAQEIRSPSGYIIGTRIEITELKNVTNALTQRELYLRATLDNLPFLFWLKDEQSRFLTVNKTFSDACGLARPEDAVGKTDFDVWPLELAEQYRADDLEVIRSLHEKQFEEQLQASYGTTWIETYKKPVIAADGKVMGTVGFSRDISDRKRVELALAEAEMRWSLAVRGANDGIWNWNLITDKVYYSERWKSMLGYGQDDIGDSANEWASRIHPDDHDRALALVNAHLQGKSEFYSCEHRLRCKDGSYKWILTRGKAFIDEHGKPLSISGSHTDISEKKIAEAIIMDRTQQLDAIFALSPDGFVSFDQNYHFKYANPAFYQLTNLDAKQLAGVTEDELSKQLALQCKDNARFIGVAALRAKLALAQNNAADHAMSREDVDGQVIELAAAGNRLLEVSLRLSKAPTVTEILYVRDVTYEVEVSRIKSEFLSTAAHELRTPMSSIFGYSELLLSRDFGAEQQRNFHQIIHKQAALVSEILNELLDLQRIESRRGKDFVFAKLDIGKLISETIAMYKVPAERAAPLLSVPPHTCFVKADRSKMIQVINNVLSNAYKYSPNGGDVEIEIAENSDQADTGFIGIKIQDHGMGMTPEQLARVCERFYRADSSGSVLGTGLGMSIVKEIVELHNGHVEISSQHGKGTTVTLWLPVDVTDCVIKRNAKFVLGDGVHTVQELVRLANDLENKKACHKRRRPFLLDAQALALMKPAGYFADSIPAEGAAVYLRKIESTEWGGIPEDMGAEIHAENISLAIEAANLLRLDVAGVDIISQDISKPWYSNGAAVNEVNFSPLWTNAIEAAKQGLSNYMQRIFPQQGRILIEVFVGADDALKSALSRQKEIANQGLRCFVSNHNASYGPQGFKIMAFAGNNLFQRARGLLMNANVDVLILVVQTDEWLSRGLPVNSINSLIVCSQQLQSIKSLHQPAVEGAFHQLMDLMRPYVKDHNLTDECKLPADDALDAGLMAMLPVKCIWFTGLSGAGKSTLAHGLAKRLNAHGKRTYILDGDEVRKNLSSDLGFSDADRVENIRRVVAVARMMADAGVIVLVSLISPYRRERQMARELFKIGEFIEVFVDTPIEECERRDVKGLYAKARRGEIKQFTGIDSVYEPPDNPELKLCTLRQSPEQSIAYVLQVLVSMQPVD